MGKTTYEMLEEFRSFMNYVNTLSEISDEVWHRPISTGKWSIKDIMSHIMLWDKYFYEEAIEKIALGQPLTVQHLNYDDFNANAMKYASTQTKEAIVSQFIEYRTKIIDRISGLAEDTYSKSYKDGDKKKFSISSYVRSFIAHDKHHKKQIEKYLKVSKV